MYGERWCNVILVFSVVAHFQVNEEAIPYLCMSERNNEQGQSTLTQAALSKSISLNLIVAQEVKRGMYQSNLFVLISGILLQCSITHRSIIRQQN